MGRWTLGKDAQTGREVFIKEFMSKRYVDNPENYENLRRANERTEAYRRLTERINSAVSKIAGNGGDVVVTTDFFREGNFLYKVNEKVNFFSWNPWEVHERLSVDETDALMLRLVNALAALHGANILHCDLKPENVFIVQQDGMYCGMISDFDDSFFMDKLPPKQDVVGTPEYMSPELAAYTMGEEDKPAEGLPLGPASDLFSIGLIYHMYLTGEMPKFDTQYYNGQLFSAMFDDAEYSLSDKLDAPHHAMIRRLLVPDPAWRTNNCTTLSHEISNIRNQRNKEYRLTLTDGNHKLKNRSVTFFGSYSISNGTEKEEITEEVQTVHVGKDGQATLKGLLPEMPLFIQCGEDLKPVIWKDVGKIKECVFSISPPKKFTILVSCDGTPLSGAKLTLVQQKEDAYLLNEAKTTDSEGKAVYSDLPDGDYMLECNGVRTPITWDDTNTFRFEMKTYRLKVTWNGKPVSYKPLTLSLCMKAGKRKVQDGATNDKGEFAFHYAVNDKMWHVACNGCEETFRWKSNGAYEWKMNMGVPLTLIALMRNSTTPVQGVRMAVAKKTESGQYRILKKADTDITGQADMGTFPSGKYYVAVLSVPKGYSLCNMKLKTPRPLTIPEGLANARVRIEFQKELILENPENVISSEDIPASVSSTWRKLIRYKDGSILLVKENGQTNKLLNAKQLGLYGLGQYKRDE